MPFEWPNCKNPKIYQSETLKTKFKTKDKERTLRSLKIVKTNYEIKIREIEDRLKKKEISKKDADHMIGEKLESIRQVEEMMTRYR